MDVANQTVNKKNWPGGLISFGGVHVHTHTSSPIEGEFFFVNSLTSMSLTKDKSYLFDVFSKTKNVRKVLRPDLERGG
jgi:hypothetical protein